jgi:response regulator RpfG family c-di-GMP phosphodiesterase
VDDHPRVLVVDDEANIRQLVLLILNRKGYAVVAAENGRAALGRLQHEAFDLVITDLQMPEMSGAALLEECRTAYPETDVIVLTAHGTIQSAVEAMKRGAVDFVTKPFDIGDLVQKVDNCLARRRMLRKERRRSPIEPLVELSRILSSPGDSSELLDSVFDLLQRTFAPASSEMTLFDSRGRDVAVAQRYQLPSELGFPRPSLAELRVAAGQLEPWLLRAPGPLSDYRPHTRSGGAITVPLLMGEEVVGALTVARRPADARYGQSDAQLLQVFGFQIAISVLHDQVRQRLVEAFQNLERTNLAAVHALFAAIETYDQYTHDHSERVANYAYELGQGIALPEGQLEELRIAGLLHDIGKLGVGDETLHKSGFLTPTEVERIHMHPVMGARILGGVEAFAAVAPLVLHHHEYYNGEGYPDRLAAEQIPLGARIIAVVDAFDSMTSDRPYRPAIPVAEALQRLCEGAASQFEERLVVAWSELVLHQHLGSMGASRVARFAASKE